MRVVVFRGAAASPQGWPPPKTSLFIQKVFDCKWYYTILRTRHFLMRRGDGRARPAGGRALTAAASAQRALAAAQKESL
jgi:hypothetical protein